MPPLPRRFRSFSLRTLMVLVGVSGLALGWLAKEHRIAAERNAYRARLESEGKVFATLEAIDLQGEVMSPPQVRWSRRLFGDKAIKYIAEWNGADHPAWEAEARRLFPEAKFVPLVEKHLSP